MSTRGDSTGPDLAQHFTPPDVARLVWRLVDGLTAGRPPDWRVVDPSAGDGALLAAARDLGVAPECLQGIEVDADLARRARARGLDVRCGDGLCGNPVGVCESSFDAVIGNPPYGRCSRAMSPAQLDSLVKGDGYSIASGGRAEGARRRLASLRAAAIEHLFLERGLHLVRPGGLVVYVLPQGLFSNARTQVVRNWILERAEVLAVLALPAFVFRRPGLNATAAVLVLRRRGVGIAVTGHTALVAPAPGPLARSALLELLLEDALFLHRHGGRTGNRTGVGVAVPASALADGRWDAEYWLHDPTPALRRCPHPLHRLGDYVDHLTYGPIVTGQRPVHHSTGIRVIAQADFTDAGLMPQPRLRVAAGSVYDPPRSRVLAGDLLLPRSGAGTLGRKRMAVYVSDQPANIGCFVDLVRLQGLNPFYTWVYLRTTTGWAQIRRLINGVGVPNISFAEIRSLRIPWIDPADQRVAEERYLREVLPHLSGEVTETGVELAGQAFGRLIADVEGYVMGHARSLPSRAPD